METSMIITCDVVSTDTQEDDMLQIKDPLENLDIYEDTPKYYLLNETVFAEPIGVQNNVDTEADNKISFIDNLMVQKEPGKRKKYYIDVDKNSPSLKCPQTDCHKTFSTTTLLRAHIRRVHCAERNKFVCERCGAGFSARYLLQRHAAVHDARTIQCAECGRALSTRTDMSVHLRRHANVRPHGCTRCGRAFVRRAALATHVRFVHRAGALRCDVCGERFSSRKLFVGHKACRSK